MNKEEFKDYIAEFNGEKVAVYCEAAKCTDVNFIKFEEGSVHFTLSLGGKQIDNENDMFAVTTAANVLLSLPKLPLKDDALRGTIQSIKSALPTNWTDETQIALYKQAIINFFIDKEIPYKRASISVKTLTNGKATSYTIPDIDVEVTTRTIVFPALESEQTAFKRLQNQVARLIEGEEAE